MSDIHLPRHRAAVLTRYCLLYGVLMLAILMPCRGIAADGEQLPRILNVAFSTEVFPDIDRRDAQVAMELWARELARKAGIPQATVTIFSKPEQISSAVAHNEMHVITMSAREYLDNRSTLKLVPAYVAANKSGEAMEQILLVRRDSGITTLRAMAGKRLATSAPNRRDPGRLWLSTLLQREGLAPPPRFFGTIVDVGKPSQAVMGVFFRQFDGAVIRRGTFSACMALNPQLGRDLMMLARSPSLVGEISCIPAGLGKRMRQAIDEAAISLHETAVGKQMTTLFQIDRVVPFQQVYLAGIESLHSKQENPRKGTTTRP